MMKIDYLLKKIFKSKRNKNFIQLKKKICQKKKKLDLKLLLIWLKCINVIYIVLHALFRMVDICNLILLDYNYTGQNLIYWVPDMYPICVVLMQKIGYP